MKIKLIEVQYDGDSIFYTQEPGDRPKFNQLRWWTEFDGKGETVSEISVQIITAALEQAFGATVAHEWYDATNVIDGGPDKPSVYLGELERCAEHVSELLMYQDAHELFPRKEA